MTILKKVKNAVKKGTDKVSNSVKETATKVGNEVKEKVEDTTKKLDNVAEQIGNEIDKAIEFTKAKAENLIADLNYQKQLIQQSQDWIEKNEVPLTEILTQLKEIQTTGGSESLQKVKQLILNGKSVEHAESHLISLQQDPQIMLMNTQAQKIGKYKTWSAQAGVEGDYVVGATGAFGYATPIFKDTDAKVKAIASLGGDLGPQIGLSGAYLWGWWKNDPKDLGGPPSITLSCAIGYITGAGVTFYFDMKKNVQGFIVSVGLVTAIEASIGVEGTLVLGKSKD